MNTVLAGHSAADFIPKQRSIDSMAGAVENCRGCELYKTATHAVFGEGPRHAKVIMVGEQPGDQEDKQGKPFVGPSGRMLDKALAEAGVDRRQVYITNAVKHFRFEPRGKLRFHKKPGGTHIRACRPWLDAEIAAIEPSVLVALGATAAQSLLGRAVTITPLRGRIQSHPSGKSLIVTVHPSSLLRAEDEESRRLAYASFVKDLKLINRAF